MPNTLYSETTLETFSCLLHRNLAVTGNPNYPSTNYHWKVASYTALLSHTVTRFYLDCYSLFTTCFHPLFHFVSITAPLHFIRLELLQSHSNSFLLVFFSSRARHSLDWYLRHMSQSMAALLSTGKHLLSHVSSNTNMVSEVWTLKDPTGMLHDIR